MIFGFSAFLRLISLNDRPRRTALRQRLSSTSENGYDYHRSFRLRARRFLVEAAPMTDVITSTEDIRKLAERQSAAAALERLDTWRNGTHGPFSRGEAVIYESTSKLFKVRFEPDFLMPVGGRRTAFHIWNTKSPRLTPHLTHAALSLVAEAYEAHENPPDDLGVLSLREPSTIYLLSTAAADPSTVATAIVERIEDDILGGGAPPSAPEDRPSP